MKYRFTDHLRERFIERTHSKFNHLTGCRQANCHVCLNLVYQIQERLKDRRSLDCEISEAVQNSTEDRSFINNTEFMSRYYERYGFDENFAFLRGEKLVFVVVQKPEYPLIVTCVPVEGHISGRARPKFRKKTIVA